MLWAQRVFKRIDRGEVLARLSPFRLVSLGMQCDRAQFERGVVRQAESIIRTDVLAGIAQVAINDFEQLQDPGDRRPMRAELRPCL